MRTQPVQANTTFFPFRHSNPIIFVSTDPLDGDGGFDNTNGNAIFRVPAIVDLWEFDFHFRPIGIHYRRMIR
jgi:hypothetical protein